MTTSQPPKSSAAQEIISAIKGLRGASGPGPSSGLAGMAFREGSLRFRKGETTGDLVLRFAYTGLHENDWEEERVYTVTPQDLADVAAAIPRLGNLAAEMRAEAEKLFAKGTPNATPAPKTARFKNSL